MAQSVTLSSIGTATMALNPVAKSTTLLLATTTTSGTIQIDISLDDPSIPGGPASTWALASSAATMNSTNLTAGLVYTLLSPVAQVRLNSTTAVTGGSHTLKALQSVSA